MRHYVLFISLLFLPIGTNAQNDLSAVTLKNGTVLRGIIKQLDPTYALTIEIAGMNTEIKMSDIAQIEAVDTNYKEKKVELIQPPKTELVPVVVADPWKDYKGFLLAKGNSVYVYCANSDEDPLSDYDKAGAEALKRLLKADGFWKVVNKMQQAHFTINYYVDTRRSDVASLSISSWRTGKSLILNNKRANESVNDNKEIARKFYNRNIVPLQRKIEKGKLSKRVIDDFTIKE